MKLPNKLRASTAAILVATSLTLLNAGAGTDVSFDFFADSVNGNDGNNCTSFSSACRTISALLTKVGSSANKRICLSKGSVWREQFLLGVQGGEINGTDVEACGSGATPVLDAADILLTGNWSKTAGFTNLYQQTIAIPTTSPTNFVQFYDNWNIGVNPYQFVGSQALADSTTCSYYIPSVQTNSGGTPGGADTIFVHTCGSTNPAVDGHTYEMSNRAYGLSLAGNNLRVVGIEARRGTSNNGSLVIFNTDTVTTSILTGVISRLGNKHNFFGQPGIVLNQPQFIDEYWGPFFTSNLSVIFTSGGSSLGATINGGGVNSGTASTFSQGVVVAGMGGGPTSALDHAAAGGIGPITYNAVKVTVSNNAELGGISSDGTSNLTISNSLFNGTRWLTHSQNSTLTLSGNQFIATTIGSGFNSDGVAFKVSNMTATLTNESYCSFNDALGQIINQGFSGINLSISGSKFRDTSHTPSFIEGVIYGDAASTYASISVNNSSFDVNDGGTYGADPVAVIYARGALTSYTNSDNNSYYPSGAPGGNYFPYWTVGTTVYNAGTGLSDWINTGHPGFGQDAHSTQQTASLASVCSPPP